MNEQGNNPTSLWNQVARTPRSRREFLALTGGAMGAGAMLLAGCSIDEPGGITGTGGPVTKGYGDISLPFMPDAPVGQIPTGLPRRHAACYPVQVEAFVAVERATRAACEANDIEFVSGYYDVDETKYVALIENFMNQGVGGMTVFGHFQEATLPLRQELINEGVFLHGWVMPYVAQVVDFDQGGVGRAQANAALDHIRKNVNGPAKVAIFTESDELLQLRWTEMRRVLKDSGLDITIVFDAEIGFTPEDSQAAGSTILQAHPDINVFLTTTGQPAGIVSLFEAQGRADDPTVAVFGVGPAQVDLDLIKKNNVYRGSVAAGYQLWGTAAGIYTADWLAGKTVPMGLKAPNRLIATDAEIDKYARDTGDPAGSWANATTRDYYVKPYGNLNYENRTSVITKPWVAPADQ